MYLVEGNLGVGKSTFLKLIDQHLPEVKILTEPVDNWMTQIHGQSLLDNFYKNPKRWAYTLETLAMTHRVRDHVREQEKNEPNLIMERSVYSGHYFFASNDLESGYFTNVEWVIYNKWADYLVHQKCKAPNGFIYLKADPEVCLKRVKKRNRNCEKTVPLSYIKQIEKWHDNFLINKENVSDKIKNTPVLVLDCNQDFLENPENMQKHVFKIKLFLEQTQNPKHDSIMPKALQYTKEASL